MLSGQMEFGQFPPDDAAYEARQRRVQRAVGLVLAVGGLIGFVWACWVLCQDGIYGWQTTNWNRLELGGLLPLPFVVVMIAPLLNSRARATALRPTMGPLQLLRLASEERFAPPAALQPAPLTAEERGGTAVFSSLRSVGNARLGAGSLWSSISLVGYALAMLAFAVPSALGQDLSSSVLGVPFFPVALTALFLAIGGVFLTLASMTRGRKGLTVVADATGLRWRRPGSGRQEQSVPWGSISSFIKLSTSVPNGVQHTVYGVNAGSAVLTWTLVSASTSREYAESDLLARWIVTRTGQPLRDLTSSAAEVALARNNPERLRALGLPEEAVAALASLKRYTRRTLWATVPILLLFGLLLAGSFVGVGRLQDYQRSYFAGLVGKVHAEAPLYQDPLLADDGQWVVEKPTAADNQESHAFVGGAYQMSGRSGQTVDALATLVYTDAAVEVTSRQAGAAQDDTSQGVGLVVRADGDQDMIVFYVSAIDGSWTLCHYLYNSQQPDSSWDCMDSGQSSAIRQGNGAANRLLVLMRGETFLLYVNDHFIEAYTDKYHLNHDLPVTGRVGMFVSDGSITGSFSDFVVYPVQSPPSLSYV